MSCRIVTVSYTGLDAGGGVPVFNRSIHAAFPDRECLHFSWTDFPWAPEMDDHGQTEWGRARILNEYLVRSRLVRDDDVVIADGFWASGLEHVRKAVSVCHGIWSHLTHEDVMANRPPDMPYHHAAQVAFRRRWFDQGKHTAAVSEFIAHQLRMQWGFVVDRVINNGVDTKVWRPLPDWGNPGKPLIMHGVNDRSNVNKGWDHIQAVIDLLGDAVEVVSFDEMFAMMRARPVTGPSETRPDTLAMADIFVHPSGFEGNSLMVAEVLACGVPIIGYDVGFLWSVCDQYGSVADRTKRSPAFTASAVRELLSNDGLRQHLRGKGRELAERYLSLDLFSSNWREYVEGL